MEEDEEEQPLQRDPIIDDQLSKEWQRRQHLHKLIRDTTGWGQNIRTHLKPGEPVYLSHSGTLQSLIGVPRPCEQGDVIACCRGCIEVCKCDTWRSGNDIHSKP